MTTVVDIRYDPAPVDRAPNDPSAFPVIYNNIGISRRRRQRRNV